MMVTLEQVSALADLKYGDVAKGGWGPRLNRRFGYFTPDDWYEALVWNMVTASTEWLDVGCGRAMFPSNPAASKALAERCKSLTGLDPSDNIQDNPYLQHRAQCMLEDFAAPGRYDLITMRMVVEHISAPAAAAAALARLCKPGGHVVIYTVDKWSPVSLVSGWTSLGFHHRVKAVLWGGEERDTFPTTYLMNTRRTLATLLAGAGFVEQSFQRLPDTRVTNRFRVPHAAELVLWRALSSAGLGYPENCLLGIYRYTV